MSWKFPNLGACEQKFVWKLRLKFPNFLKRGSCELTLLLEMGPLRAAGEAWKGGLQGRTSPYPLSRSVPPRGGLHDHGSFHTDRINEPHTHPQVFLQMTVYILRVWKCTGMKVHGYEEDRGWKCTGMNLSNIGVFHYASQQLSEALSRATGAYSTS